MRKGQLALRSRSPPCVLVPVADNRVTAVLDQVEIVGNDLLDRPSKTWEIAVLPGARLAGFGCSQVFHLVFGRIVNVVSQGLEHRSDHCAPAFAEVRRVFDGACEIEKHERRLSAIQGCRSTQIWRGLGRVFQRFSYALSEILRGAREPYGLARSPGSERFVFHRRGRRGCKEESAKAAHAWHYNSFKFLQSNSPQVARLFVAESFGRCVW